MFCTQRHRGKLQLPTRAPGRSHHVLTRGHNTQKKAPAYFLTGFLCLLMKVLKPRSVITMPSGCTTPTLTKEHFTIQAVPETQVKTSVSTRQAEGSSLAQSKGHCCTWVL